MEISKQLPGTFFIHGEMRNTLSELRIQGFKAFLEENTIPIAPITLIFGKNSCGKSALIQSLALMREMLATDDPDIRYTKTGGNQIDLGGFENYVNRTFGSSGIGEVRIEVKFASRLRKEGVTSYGVTLGLNPLVDNQFARTGIYGKDLKYITKNITIANSYLHLETGMNVNLKGIESSRLPYSYHVVLNVTDWGKRESGTISSVLDESLLRYSKEKSLFVERSSELLGRDIMESEIKQLVDRVAREWLKKQRRLFSYACNGANLELSGFLPGGYMICDDDICDSVDYFVNVGDSDTREDACKSIRKFIANEYSEEIKEIDLNEEDIFKKVLNVIDVEIPAEFEKHSNQSYSDLHQLLDSLRYLGPIREMPGRVLTDRFSDLDKRFDYSGRSVYSEIRNSQELRNKVNEWLSSGIFSKKYSFFLDEMSELRFYELNRYKNIEVSLQDVGSGLSQVIPVLTFCLGNSLKTLLLEQPELHLHPSGAAEMGDLLIQSALTEKGNTVIAETHSEHIVLRVLKRIRQTTEGVLPDSLPPVKPEDVSILFVQPREDGKGSEVIRIPVTEDGDILFGWPDGFMPDRLAEFII